MADAQSIVAAVIERAVLELKVPAGSSVADVAAEFGRFAAAAIDAEPRLNVVMHPGAVPEVPAIKHAAFETLVDIVVRSALWPCFDHQPDVQAKLIGVLVGAIVTDPRLAVVKLPGVPMRRVLEGVQFEWMHPTADERVVAVVDEGRIRIRPGYTSWNLERGDDPMPWLTGVVGVALRALEAAKAVRNG